MNFQGQDLPTTSVPPGNISRGGYNLTSNNIECIPSGLRNSYCAHFYVEFFDIRKEAHLKREYPNHAIIKIEFAEKCGEYEGVGIDIVAVFDGTVSQCDLDFSKHTPGKMVILPLKYKNASPIATRTFQFSPPPQTAPRLLGDVLASITKAGLQHFDFSGEMRGPLLRGCRDFIYQVFIHLIISGYTENRVRMIWPTPPLQLQVQYLSDIMGKHYSDEGDVEHPVRRGRFRIYQRKLIGISQP